MLARTARTSFLLLVLAGCVPEVGSSSQEIVNGVESAPGARAAVVLLTMSSGSCSGTLISPHVVLTARHCLAGENTNTLQVFFGNDYQGDGTWIDVDQFTTHSTGDLGLITLAQVGPATPIPPGSQALSSADVGTQVLLVGFGQTGDGTGAGIKREGTTTIESLDQDVMYVGSTGAKTCFGDSGGPTLVARGGVTQVIGAAGSITNEDCTVGQSVNTRVDLYYDWIAAYVEANDPSSCPADGVCGEDCTQVDPDCPCAEDGFCTSACPDYLTDDPDCANCGTGDSCQTECPELDIDCCADDGSCYPACGTFDPDCQVDNPTDGGVAADDPGQKILGGCRAGGHAGSGAIWLILALVALARRRR